MRTKTNRRYNYLSPAGTTFTPGIEVISIAEYFDAGLIQINGILWGGLPAGQWATVTIAIDGKALPDAPGPGTYAVGTNTYAMISAVARIPQGHHRVGLIWSSGSAPSPNTCAGFLNVAEL